MERTAIIKSLGGRRHVAASLGKSVNTVNGWIRRDSIPAKYWAALMAIKPGAVTPNDFLCVQEK